MSIEVTPTLCEEMDREKRDMEEHLEVHLPGVLCIFCTKSVPLNEIQYGPNEECACHECFNEKFSQCKGCDDLVNAEDLRVVFTTSREQAWCGNCIAVYARACSHCHKIISMPALAVRHPPICGDCYNDHYFTCDCCLRVFNNDAYESEGLCYSCYHQRDDDSDDDSSNEHDGLLPYDDKTASKMTKLGNPKDGLYFGVELEVESQCSSRRCQDIKCCIGRLGFAVAKEDGSLSQGKGFELVTSPATVAVHRERWGKLLNNLPPGLKSWSGYQCGMHIHVSRKPLSLLTIGKLLVFINLPANKQFVVCLAGREDGEYALIYPKKVSDARSMLQRREAINLQNRNTIEFRIFRGTTNFDGFMKNLEFVEAAVRFCQWAGIRNMRYTEFANFVADRRKQYPALSNWLSQKGYISSPKTKPINRSAKPCA